MVRIANAILKCKKSVLAAAVILSLLSVAGMLMVKVNYNLSDYLPDKAPSTIAMKVMEESFADDIPNVNVYVPKITIPQAVVLKEKFSAIKGVGNVMWLDDVADVYQPIEMQEKKLVEAWYKNGDALFVLYADILQNPKVVEEIKQVAGTDSMMSGEAVNQSTIQNTTMDEIGKIILYVLPLVLLVLLIATSSWFEPVLFLLVIGVAILVNEGTNIIFGEISYITRATSAVLQLAVSIDYAVFLLHSFARFRRHEPDIREAMKKAMVESSSTIAASAATTVFGFLALVLMKFKIGADMGLVLAKGVFISYISVMVLLPVIAMFTTKLMDNTHHRKLLPSFTGLGKTVVRICIPLAVVIAIILVPGFLAQRSNEFVYGSSGMHSEGSALKTQAEKISSIFGKSQQMVLLVPDGDSAGEKSLIDDLKNIEHVNTVISYTNIVGVQVPEEFIEAEQLSQLRAGGYNRIILYSDTEDEGQESFNLIAEIRAAAENYYEGEYHLVGQNVINSDLKDTITGDSLPVLLASMIAIGLVLIITFKSITLPLILLITIEGAIWINLGLPYFTGGSLNYIGYQIISAVQLGATVDYGILFSNRYLNNRRLYDKSESARRSVAETAASILTPAGILTIAGLVLGIISTNGIISQMGTILGRGAAISAFMVLFFLPALLMIFDKLIRKTTFMKLDVEKEVLKEDITVINDEYLENEIGEK